MYIVQVLSYSLTYLLAYLSCHVIAVARCDVSVPRGCYLLKRWQPSRSQLQACDCRLGDWSLEQGACSWANHSGGSAAVVQWSLHWLAGQPHVYSLPPACCRVLLLQYFVCLSVRYRGNWLHIAG